MVKLNKTPEGEGRPTAGDISNSGMTLLSFVERLERLDEEKQGIIDDRKEVVGEAKATGFDTKIIARCIRIRKMDPGDYEENESLTDTYLRAIRDAEKAQTAASVKDGGE